MNLEEMQARAEAVVSERRSLIEAAVSEQRGLSEDESTRVTALDDERSSLKLAIEDRKAEAARTAEQDEARKAAGLDKTISSVTSIHEPRTYELSSERGYYWDLAQVALNSTQADESRSRLAAHNYELAVEVAQGTKEGRAVEATVRAERRDASAAASAIRTLRERGQAGGAGSEQRALTTATGSGGAFAPPVYLLDLYAPFRTAGRSFIDSLQDKPLPSTGMTIDIPAMGNAAAVTTQSTQNTGVGETDPDAAYISANVSTLAGEITVSQQLLDRTGPWDGSYDAVMFDQLTRDYNTQADIFALTAALAGAGALAYPSTLSVADTYLAVNGAQSVIRSTAGVFRNPTAAFVIPARWSWLASQVDSQGRPLIVPNAQAPMNAVMAGGDSPGVEGFTGYNMAGLDVYQDASIPTPSAGNDQIIVLDPSAVLVFEGDLVPRVLPQTLGNQLSVILQVYAYIAVLPLYPLAVQAISGSVLVAPTF